MSAEETKKMIEAGVKQLRAEAVSWRRLKTSIEAMVEKHGFDGKAYAMMQQFFDDVRVVQNHFDVILASANAAEDGLTAKAGPEPEVSERGKD